MYLFKKIDECRSWGGQWAVFVVSGFLNNAGSSLGLGGLGELSINLSFRLALFAKLLNSLINSIGVALYAVGTKDRPLLRSRICVLVSCTLDRLTILLTAHSKQLCVVHCSTM